MLQCWCNTLTNICSTGESFPLQPGLDKRQQRRASCHHNLEKSAELRVTASSARQDMGSDKAVATVITLLTICLLLTNTSAGLLQVHSDMSFYFYLCRELLIFSWFWVVVIFCLMCSSCLFYTAYSCCRSYTNNRIPFKIIKGFTVQTATSMCRIDAIMWVLTE